MTSIGRLGADPCHNSGRQQKYINKYDRKPATVHFDDLQPGYLLYTVATKSENFWVPLCLRTYLGLFFFGGQYSDTSGGGS